jgi:hypothetical protein
MTHFVHLSDAKLIPAIRKNGIKAGEVRNGSLKGFYCTPVTKSVYKTHQWLRELKRRGIKTIDAVQFYLPPSENVFVGLYNEDYISVSASEAANIFETHETGLGLEVVVPRTVTATEIHSIYSPSQVTGWRFHPDAKGQKPFCGCKFCNRGEINAYRFVTEE